MSVQNKILGAESALNKIEGATEILLLVAESSILTSDTQVALGAIYELLNENCIALRNHLFSNGETS